MWNYLDMQIFRRSWRLWLRGPTAQHEVAWHRPPAGPGAPHTAQRHHFLYTLAISYLREYTRRILLFLYSVFIETLHSYMQHSTFIICFVQTLVSTCISVSTYLFVTRGTLHFIISPIKTSSRAPAPCAASSLTHLHK